MKIAALIATRGKPQNVIGIIELHADVIERETMRSSSCRGVRRGRSERLHEYLRPSKTITIWSYRALLM